MDEARHREAERRLWESLGVRPRERPIDLARTGATVRLQELGEGPPVLFVHGASISGTSWAPLVAELPGFHCILLDRPGCGLSPPLATSLQDVAALEVYAEGLIVDVLDALGLDRCDVVATSFGGYLALRTAAAHPERVGRFVEMGFPIGAPVGRLPIAMRMAAAPVVGRLMMSIPPNERAVKAMLRNIGLGQALDAGRIGAEAIEWNLSLWRDTDTMRNELRTLPRIMRPIGGLDERMLLPGELLASIGVPAYFLWGDEDPFGGGDIARSFTSQLPEASLELVPGAGHAVWMDDADHAAAVVRDFLGQ